MEIIKNFGIQPVLLIAQIINFLIILFVLKKLLYKPVLKMLKSREATIKEGIEKTEEVRKLMEKTLEEEKNILKKAQAQATILIEEAKKQSLEIAKQTEENSKKQAEKILNDAKAQIEREAKETEQKLTGFVGKLAVELLQKTSGEYFGKKEQGEILSKAIKSLKGK